MPTITIKIDCIINPNKIEVAHQFQKLGLILGEIVKWRKKIENKVAILTWYVTLLVTFLLDAIYFIPGQDKD